MTSAWKGDVCFNSLLDVLVTEVSTLKDSAVSVSHVQIFS